MKQCSIHPTQWWAAAIALSLWLPVWATMNEALSYAFEAATPYVEEGYEVRQDNWTGDVKAGEPKLIKHQLFRGNQYWFWGGTSTAGYEVAIEIYDSDGLAVSLEHFSKDGKSGSRVNPAKTGTYSVMLKAEKPGADSATDDTMVDWALVYGYR